MSLYALMLGLKMIHRLLVGDNVKVGTGFINPQGQQWSGNGFLPDSTKPLPGPMVIYHQSSGLMTFIRGKFHKRS